MNNYTILKGMLEIAPKQDVRYYLNALLIAKDYIAVSDGHALIKVTTETPVNEDVILCRKDLANKLKLFSKKNPPQMLQKEDGFYLNELKIETIEGNYPDLNRVICIDNGKGTYSPIEVGFNLALLSKLTKAVNIIANSKLEIAKMIVHDAQSPIRIERPSIVALLMPARL